MLFSPILVLFCLASVLAKPTDKWSRADTIATPALVEATIFERYVMLHLKSFKAKLLASNPVPKISAQMGSPKNFPSSSKAHPSFLHKRPAPATNKRGGPLRLTTYALKKRAQVPSPDFKEGSTGTESEWDGEAANWEWSGESEIEHSAKIMSKRAGLIAGIMESKMKNALRIRKVLR